LQFLGLCALLAIALGVAACSTTRPWSNEPLGAEETVRYDGLAQLLDSSRPPDVLVVANFSGGGSRAKAFAHAFSANSTLHRSVGEGARRHWRSKSTWSPASRVAASRQRTWRVRRPASWNQLAVGLPIEGLL
jgi:hypothetical protein